MTSRPTCPATARLRPLRRRSTAVLRAVALAALVGLVIAPAPSFADIVVTGDVTPDHGDAGSPDPWNLGAVDLWIGNVADGTLAIDDGSSVSTTSNAIIGREEDGDGTLTIADTNSQLTAEHFHVGSSGTGTLNIENGGSATLSGITSIGANPGSSGDATVTGDGSIFTTNGVELRVGFDGAGTLLIEAGGRVENNPSYIGRNTGSTGTVTVTGSGSTWDNSADLYVGFEGTGTLNVADGGEVSSNRDAFIGSHPGSPGEATVTGSGSTWRNSHVLTVGNYGAGTLNVEDGGQVRSAYGSLGYSSASTGTATVTGSGSMWKNTAIVRVGFSGDGTLRVEDGGEVSNAVGYIGYDSGSTGTVTVTGNGSTWKNAGDIFVGNEGAGTLLIEAGGRVENHVGYIGHSSGSQGTATVSGSGSTWTNSNNLYVGRLGDGTLNVADGGEVSNADGNIGHYLGSQGTATVSGSGSTWTNSGNLYVGREGTGVLNVADGGAVHVDDALDIGQQGTVNLIGGTLRFDTYRNNGGTVNYTAGTIQLAGDRDVGLDAVVSEFFGQGPAIPHGKELTIEGTAALKTSLRLDGGRFTAGRLTNAELLDFQAGTLRLTASDLSVGDGGTFGKTLALDDGQRVVIDQAVHVEAAGVVELRDGGRLSAGELDNAGRLTGSGRIDGPVSNRGEIEAMGASGAPVAMHFTGAVTNETDGRMAVRNANLRFEEGLSNQGTLAASFGTSDVFGQVTNEQDGEIIISGGGEVTFWDDVTQNGTLHVSASGTRTSAAVFFGDYTGSGASGGGDIFFEGQVSPGNSPGLAEFGGNVHLGASATLIMELAGTVPGLEYDHLDVAGTLGLDGTLDIALLDDFQPQLGDTFNFFSFGAVTGAFNALNLPELDAGLVWYDQLATTGSLAVVAAQLLGSMLLGAVMGVAMAWYVEKVQAQMVIFVVGCCMLFALLGDQYFTIGGYEGHLEPLLIALSAGLVMRNVWPRHAQPLFHTIEQMSLPVYALFFAVAGANVNLALFAQLWQLSVALVGVRVVAVWAGIKLGAMTAKLHGQWVRYLWLGLIPQAGVSLVLVEIIGRGFADMTWSVQLTSVLLSMIVLQQLLGPIGLRFALIRTGEAGRARHASLH